MAARSLPISARILAWKGGGRPQSASPSEGACAAAPRRYTAAPMSKVGGEVDAFCTRCELTLAHTVIAMVDGRPVKVECNTCHGVHRYRSESAAARPAARPARERKLVVSFEETLRQKRGAARPYSVGATYALDDVIQHPSFGVGWVSAVRDPGKIEVTFRAEVKTLVHGKAPR